MENLKKFIKRKNIPAATKEKPTKSFKTLSRPEKDDLLEQMLKDLGYIK